MTVLRQCKMVVAVHHTAFPTGHQPSFRANLSWSRDPAGQPGEAGHSPRLHLSPRRESAKRYTTLWRGRTPQRENPEAAKTQRRTSALRTGCGPRPGNTESPWEKGCLRVRPKLWVSPSGHTDSGRGRTPQGENPEAAKTQRRNPSLREWCGPRPRNTESPIDLHSVALSLAASPPRRGRQYR